MSEDLEVIPCSFGCGGEYIESLREKSIKDIWKGEKFTNFRKILEEDRYACPMIMR